MDLFRVQDDQVWLKKTLKILATDIRQKPKKNYKTCSIYFTCSNIKEKNHLWLNCVQLTGINRDMSVTFKSLYVFSGWGKDTNKNEWSRRSSISEHLCCNFFRTLHPQKLQGYLLAQLHSYISQNSTIILIFPRLPKGASALRQQEAV